MYQLGLEPGTSKTWLPAQLLALLSHSRNPRKQIYVHVTKMKKGKIEKPKLRKSIKDHKKDFTWKLSSKR